MPQIVEYRGTNEDLRRLLGRLPAVLSGHGSDPFGIARGLLLRLGMVLLSKVQQAFIAKARGGTGEDGIRWPPLKKSTIANRRPAPRKKKGERPMGLLTAEQDKRWRTIFGSRYAMFIAKFGLSPADAKARAAQIAWAILKSEGAKTKLDVYGNRVVETLRDTGELLRSLSPGVAGPSGVPGQVFQVKPGSVTVGTNKKTWHHRGIPGRLPARPFWPDRIPAVWWDAMVRAYNRGLVQALTVVLSRGARP